MRAINSTIAGLGLLLAVSACGDSATGLAGKVKSAGIDSTATIEDNEKAQALFKATFGELQGAVAEGVAQGLAEAQGGATPSQASGSQSFDIDTTINGDDGQTLTVVGSVSVQASETGAISQQQDITVTWTGFPVELSGETVTTSGKVVMTADITVGADQSLNGTATQIGQITAGGETFGFDIVITLAGTSVSYVGTINGETQEFTFDTSGLDGGGDGDDSDSLEVTTGSCPAVPDLGTVCIDIDGVGKVTGTADAKPVVSAGKANFVFRVPGATTAVVQFAVPDDAVAGTYSHTDGASVTCWEAACGKNYVNSQILGSAAVKLDEFGTTTGDKVKGAFTATGVVGADDTKDYRGSFYLEIKD